MSNSSCPPSLIQSYLEELHAKYQLLRTGAVATYIPELGKADPEWFGICVVTCDGQVYQVGDTALEFTIQSISKPFSYGIALQDSGKEKILSKIWMEPSGEAFNSISLDPIGRPLNPMINAGAIATTGLVEGSTTRQKVHRILDTFSRYAGRSLTIDQAVSGSESATGHRNRAIAYMLRNFDIFTEDPLPSLEAYFQQCSILVNCLDLAFMGATLANNGIHPLTGQRAVVADYVENILSVMASCGMYDAAGEWLYNVGMPAKSGVGGGILAVLPGQLAVAVFSPLLDDHGNSARGIAVCRELSSRFKLHLFNSAKPGLSVIRHLSDATRTSSNRARPLEETSLLSSHGSRIVILEIQGHLSFAATERVVRELHSRADAAFAVILDFSRVQHLDLVSNRILLDTFAALVGRGVWVHLAHSHHLPLLVRSARKRYGDALPALLRWDQNTDTALEFAENRLLESLGERHPSSQAVPFAACQITQGFTSGEITALESLMQPRDFAAGSQIFESGEEAADLLVILRGKASISLDLASGQTFRLTTCTPGMTFGEMAVLDGSPRSATVVADTEIAALSLSTATFRSLAASHPAILSKILINIARSLAARLRRQNTEIVNNFK